MIRPTIMTRSTSRLLRWLGVGLFAAIGITGAGYAHRAMAPTATGSFSLSLTATQRNTVDLGTASFTGTVGTTVPYNTSGTGTGQIDRFWSDSNLIVASGADTLDLAGVLTDAFGATFTCVKLKTLVLQAMAGNTNNVEFRGGVTNGFAGFLKDTTDVLVLKPGYEFGIGGSVAGFPVTAGTGDKVIVRNSAGTSSVSYKIGVGCTSA